MTFTHASHERNPKHHSLTVVVEGVNSGAGNLGVLLFSDPKGWPEDWSVALKDVVVPARSGSETVTIPDLPEGEYAVAVGHDANVNRRVDKNWFGKPTEQWGMSNNPHATLRPPSFDRAKFLLDRDLEIHIKLQ